jgi:hypothetical protein|tara:strand:- start:377 stop:583 length:207 start_codon:yes stop_codon:yes gene_type:complete
MIKFIDAQNGGLELTLENGNTVFGATTEELALYIAKYDLANVVMAKSAARWDDAAQVMWRYAVKLSGV